MAAVCDVVELGTPYQILLNLQNKHVLWYHSWIVKHIAYWHTMSRPGMPTSTSVTSSEI